MNEDKIKFDAFSLDNCILMKNGYRLNSGLLNQIKNLKNLPVEIVISEIVHREALKHLSIEISKTRNNLKNDFQDIESYLPIEREKISKAKELLTVSESEFEIAELLLKKFYEEIGAKIILFDDYANYRKLIDSFFQVDAPFKNGKKNEFPDAISLITLENWSKQHNKKLIAVSTDDDWKEFAEKYKTIHVSNNLAETLERFQNFELLQIDNHVLNLIANNVNILNSQNIIEEAIKDGVESIDFVVEADSNYYWDEEDSFLSFISFNFSESDILYSGHFVEINQNYIILSVNVKIMIEAHSNFSFSVRDSIDKDYIGLGTNSFSTDDEIDSEILITFDTKSLLENDIKVIKAELANYGYSYIHFGEIEPDFGYEDYDE